ncbi:MAG TPA: carboxypeptidase regulatory-like domain-containing protein [Acidobacteriaceae bacterium]|jgi:hypothetical protein
MKLITRLALFAVVALPLTLSAATISGTVMDRTTNKPAAGDTAVLLDLQQAMTESARTTIDAKGHYSFNVPDNAGMHLVQVEHEKASYYGPVPPNTSVVNIDVYDVVSKVDGLHLYADVSRMETDPQGLSVTESYFIRNESKPAKTQLSQHTFEFYLPPDAVLEGATATGPGGMAVSSAPVPVGDKGHYAFIFPLRPGETRFQVGYRLPYSGSAKLQAHVSLPAENVAVMLPKSMTFDGGKDFQALGSDASGPGTQTWLATNLKPETLAAFTVSGTGSMPREQQNPQGGPGQGMGQGAPGMGAAGDQGAVGGGPAAGSPDQTQANGPGGGVAGAVPIGTPDPLQKYKWYIFSALGLALVIAAAFMLRAKPGQTPSIAAAEPSPLTPTLPPGVRATEVRAQAVAAVPVNGAAQKTGTISGTLAALKEELFQLETERLEGKISDAEYAEHKAALEVLLKRALARQAVTQ